MAQKVDQEDINKAHVDRLYIIIMGVVIVLFVAFLSLAYAYEQFIITNENSRLVKIDNLIDKVNTENAKLDLIYQQFSNAPTPKTK